ncbi:AAA family ATPase [Dorea sp. YH-dor228]|uniref:McrB family protein n=1 Tax=Dorea sp. YH-dor228 TaxID=3151120 RepID=UPI003242D577
MFADLMDKEIQPKSIDVRHLPEIEISDGLKNEIQEVLEKEESNYAHVFGRTAVVQTDKNYVFFSNQWLYLAVLCKKYAEALKPYGDFFDKEIRGKKDRLKIFASKNYESSQFKELIPDETDRERMIKFVTGDPQFRPGKSLINGESARSTKDIFGSCVLKKIAVPDSSSAYLGNLIYYLSKRPELYNAIEAEVLKQLGDTENTSKLPSVVKDCAKAIVDNIYKIDQFERISERFEVMDQNIKIDTSNTDGLLPNGNWLRYMFARPSSGMYSPESSDGKTRVFENEYVIFFKGEKLKCKLTTEWVGSEVVEGAQGNNYLQALIKLVNRYYSDVLEIKEESGEYYLYFLKKEFLLEELPNSFDSSFSRRYITSLLAKPFVILTGNSGTGKTRISKQFAEYLEVIDINGEKNWLIVPVGADWTDNARVLGFYNPLADNGVGKYEKTGIIKLIERANDNPEIPYFLILDEMNLSHVERYFSDFLSHMETPDNPFEIDGYRNKDDEDESTGKLPYPENLFVIGTVNIDETTYMFSPKVLDRANVVEFKPDKDDVLNMFSSASQEIKITPAKSGVSEAFLRLAKEIRSGKSRVDEWQMAEVRNVFTAIYDITEKNGYEFAYRTVREIKQYISAAYELSGQWADAEIYRAIDEQLLQKVLPKIHGNRKEIGTMLDELEAVCKQNGKELELSRRKIEQMKGKLAAVQYASFI